MKITFSLIVILASFIVSANSAEITKEEQRYRRTGGEIIKRGTYLGNVLIVSAQSKLSYTDVTAVRNEIHNALNMRITSIQSKEIEPLTLMKSNNANIVLIIIDEPSQPSILVAPEDRWAKVNVAKLVDDLPGENAKNKFFTPRARKMIIKAFSLLCGGGSSQFPDNIMNTATIRELDMVKEQIPVDMIDFWIRYLSRIGVTQPEITTYRKACREGWAPAPTNDIQKAIWDKVRSEKERGPTNPIEIPMPKKK
jgi:hypothetical protein